MRKGEVRRQSIIEASERLFSAKGYLETTVDDILAELQCSKGSFYHYFDSKLSVLTAICEEKVRLWFDAYKKTRVTSTEMEIRPEDSSDRNSDKQGTIHFFRDQCKTNCHNWGYQCPE